MTRRPRTGKEDIMADDEDKIHVYPLEDGRWCVRPAGGREIRFTRKAIASLQAMQIVVNGGRRARVTFYNADGTVEFERLIENSQPRLA
jgi:hypothetical protein